MMKVRHRKVHKVLNSHCTFYSSFIIYLIIIKILSVVSDAKKKIMKKATIKFCSPYSCKCYYKPFVLSNHNTVRIIPKLTELSQHRHHGPKHCQNYHATVRIIPILSELSKYHNNYPKQYQNYPNTAGNIPTLPEISQHCQKYPNTVIIIPISA